MTKRCIVHGTSPKGVPTEVDRTSIIQGLQLLVGAKPDGDPGPLTLAAVKTAIDRAEAATVPPPAEDIDVTVEEELPPTQKDGSGMHRVALTLGQLALAYALEEAERWGTKPVSEQVVKDYLRGCTRENKPGHGSWLADTYSPSDKDKRFAFCAAALGFTEDRGGGAQFRGAMPPWRSGALEIRDDAKAGRRPNERWAPASEFWDDAANRFIKAPPVGSIVVYQNRLDATKGHVERLIEANSLGFRSVGANENDRRWVIDKHPISWRLMEKSDGVQRLFLLGFVVPLEVQA